MIQGLVLVIFVPWVITVHLVAVYRRLVLLEGITAAPGDPHPGSVIFARLDLIVLASAILSLQGHVKRAIFAQLALHRLKNSNLHPVSFLWQLHQRLRNVFPAFIIRCTVKSLVYHVQLVIIARIVAW